MTNVRFHQRFENFDKSFQLLKRSIAHADLNEMERGGLIQFFEVTFELGWKCLGDYLEDEGFSLISPKQILKQAFKSGLIDNGELWLQALEDRNLTSHTYNEQTSINVERVIRKDYFALIENLHAKLSSV